MDQFDPIHRSRHFCIREYQVDILPSLQNPDGFTSAAGLKSLEPGLNQDLQDGHAHQRVVLDHQNDSLANCHVVKFPDG
jgi:hypothetical protein